MVFEYQEIGIEWLRQHSLALLGDEPGLGKTRQLLLAAEGRTLVVAPAGILAADVWTNEHKRWRPDLDLTQVSYHKLIQSQSSDILRKEYRQRWDSVIFDEAHHLKNRKAHWTLATQRQMRYDRLMLATGTAIPNWAKELWSLLYLLHPGDKRFTSYWRWAEEWFECEPTRFSPMAVGEALDNTPAGWRRFIEANLGGQFLMRTWDDVGFQLPPLTEQTLAVPMVPAQARAYKDLKKDYLAWVEETGAEIVAWNSGARHTQLCKAATGLQVLDSTATKGSGKLDLLKELLANRLGQRTLVVAHFRDAVRAAAETASKLGQTVAYIDGSVPTEQRGRIIKEFQTGGFDVVVATLATISEGYPLTAATACIFLEHSWTPSKNTQALRRIWRIGQERPCLVIHLVTRGTVDEQIQRVLAEKTDQQMMVYKAREFANLL